MPNLQEQKRRQRLRRHRRIRARVKGSRECPRLSVFRSQRWMTVQLIDDVSGKTLFATSDKREKLTGKPLERARALGALLAQACQQQGITRVVYDRGGYRYHGRVAAVADGARESGLRF